MLIKTKPAFLGVVTLSRYNSTFYWIVQCFLTLLRSGSYGGQARIHPTAKAIEWAFCAIICRIINHFLRILYEFTVWKSSTGLFAQV